jgi:23S rRNA pseudouridine1911/1915/1917 synthase
LSVNLANFSRSAIGDLCDRGLVLVNNKKEKKNHRLSNGDKIVVEIEPKPETSVQAEDIPLDILYEDEFIIAVNKPYGMVVHPAPGSPNGTFVNALVHHLGDSAAALFQASSDQTKIAIYPNNEIVDNDELIDLPETPEAASASPISLRPGIVHRLDKGTSGVLIAAKSTDAVAKLSSLFALRKVRKVYLAICVGHPGETTLVEPIGRCQRNRQLMTVYDGPPGKPAITHVKTISFDGKMSAALVRIETGRTHQIRVHLKNRRTPILGDEDYGNREWNNKIFRSDKINRPLLHAYETEFEHPYTGTCMKVFKCVLLTHILIFYCDYYRPENSS